MTRQLKFESQYKTEKDDDGNTFIIISDSFNWYQTKVGPICPLLVGRYIEEREAMKENAVNRITDGWRGGA